MQCEPLGQEMILNECFYYVLVEFGTSMSAKKVDPELYKSSAPTVDIIEDNREENFRLDINSWTLNKHKQQNRQQNKQSVCSVLEPLVFL